MIDKVVVRFVDGKILKGYLDNFSEEADQVSLREDDEGGSHVIPVESLKAIFFVRSFEGKREYNEKKMYGIGGKRGDRAFVKFKDGETMVGFLMGDVPWDRQKGYYLSKTKTGQKGFYLLPVDLDSNNIKVFVILSSIDDVSIMS